MECPVCKARTPGIIEDNALWCNQCGVRIQANTEFVPSYNQRYGVIQQVYSRLKRFTKYMQLLNIPEVLADVYRILDLYSSFEFTWTCNRKMSRRIYFFAKPVMLRMCCKLLHIECALPGLKDKMREREQYCELLALMETATFKISIQTKGGTVSK